jgi:hypothetical protein
MPQRIFSTLVVMAAALSGCSATNDPGTRAPGGQGMPKRVGTLGAPEWEGRLHYVERRVSATRPLRATAMRAGGGISAVLQADPYFAYLVELTPSRSLSISGGPNNWDQRADNPPRGYPTDVVGVAPDGSAWFLDAGTGRVVTEDVGGYRRVVTTLRRADKARSGCVSRAGSILFVGDARPRTVAVRPLEQPSVTRALVVPAEDAVGRGVPWAAVRFGGSPDGPCVLWAPSMTGVLIVSDSAVRPLGPLVERLPAEPWYRMWWHRIRRRPEPVWTLDATSFPGGVALLAAGRTAGAGRMVDLYSDAGAYLETLVLPQRALRIAGDGERLYVLRQARDSVLLASYLLPRSVRARIQQLPLTARAPGTVRPAPGAPVRDSAERQTHSRSARSAR